MLKKVGRWLHDRLGLEPFESFIREHKVPAEVGGSHGWRYVFGFATLTAFLIQVGTGVGLSTAYIPSPAHAHDSLLFINRSSWGAFLRAAHYFGASAMVVLIHVHMARTFLTASYKFPRQMTWIVGVILLVLTMTMAVTGQLLRWDQDGLWTVLVASKFVSRVPLVGEPLARFVLGGESVGGPTLVRFASLHMIVLPALIVATIGLHLYLVVYHGISESPVSGRKVDPERYEAWYARQKKSGIEYFPGASFRENILGFLVVVAVGALALAFGPHGPGPPPDPTDLAADPRPDWYLRFYYAVLWLKPSGLESLFMVWLPIAAVLTLVALPILFPAGERHPSRRPWAPALVAGAVIGFGILTAIGMRPPWTPAYDAPPLSAERLGVAEGPVAEGARLFTARGCQLCHAVLGEGGGWGPDLTRVAARIGPEEIAVRIVKGFGDMPAYRDAITEEELEAILAFLEALPARAEALEP